MGVLRFFYWVLRNMPKTCWPVNKKFTNGGKFRPDMLLVDCNAVFHPCFRDVFCPEKLSDVWKAQSSQETQEEKIDRAINGVCQKIEDMIRLSNPSKALYLAVDGVAGCCKQSQQRKRRFKAAKDRKASGDTGFDFSQITAGTGLMFKICQKLEQHFSTRSSEFTVFINPVGIPGEGEHKLIRAMTGQKKYRSFYIYSPDADLIMLSMLTGLRNITILRENIYDNIRGDWILVNIDKLKREIAEKLSLLLLEETPQEIDPQRVVRDVVLFMFMLGNDFVPNVPSLDIAYDGIDTLFWVYSRTVGKWGYLIGDDQKFNKKAVVALFEALADKEPELLLTRYMNNRAKWPDTVLQANISRENGIPQIRYESYAESYYARNFQADVSRETICEEYMRGISFVINYYLKGIPSFDWYYPFHYAPLFGDLKKWCGESDLDFRFQYKPPLSLTEALVSVLPPSAFCLLPDPVRGFMTDRGELDPDFSDNFEIDLEGKQQDYEAVLLLPMVPYEKIQRLLKPFKLKDPEVRLTVIDTQ